MDPDERALLNAIIAQPEEDTPRLVYADWLQEHDRPERAEYIRLSIELANLRYGDATDEQRYWQLRAVRDPLVDRWHKKWLSEFAAQFPSNRDLSFAFVRGFVERAACSVRYFARNAEQMIQMAPIRVLSPRPLTSVTAKSLVASRWFRNLRAVEIIEFYGALALLECPALDINTISFSHFYLYGGRTNPTSAWDEVALQLARHGDLTSVKRINLESCGIGDAGGGALADATDLAPDVLNLVGNTLSEPIRRALRQRYGSHVWLDPGDRTGTRRGDGL